MPQISWYVILKPYRFASSLLFFVWFGLVCFFFPPIFEHNKYTPCILYKMCYDYNKISYCLILLVFVCVCVCIVVDLVEMKYINNNLKRAYCRIQFLFLFFWNYCEIKKNNVQNSNWKLNKRIFYLYFKRFAYIRFMQCCHICEISVPISGNRVIWRHV